MPIRNKKISRLFISIGTWAILAYETEKPIFTSEVLLSGFGNEAGADNTNLLVKETTGLWIMQRCMEKWRSERNGNFEWEDINSIYNKAKRFLSFIDVYDPVFGIMQKDMPKVIRDYCKNLKQDIPQSVAGISRCFYESLVFKFRYYFEIFKKITGEKFELVHMVGGGIKNKLFCQWVSDCLGIPVDAGPVETTAVGNLIMQLKAAGEINNLEEGRQISANSSEILNYEPNFSEKDIWDEAYQVYYLFFNKMNRNYNL